MGVASVSFSWLCLLFKLYKPAKYQVKKGSGNTDVNMISFTEFVILGVAALAFFGKKSGRDFFKNSGRALNSFLKEMSKEEPQKITRNTRKSKNTQSSKTGKSDTKTE